MHKKMYEELKHTQDIPEMVDAWLCIFMEHMEALEEAHPDKYAALEEQLYVATYGAHFNESMALKAVEGMVNEDGTHGAHFTPAETDRVAQRMGIDFESGWCNRWDWYYTLNMIYSDYFGAVPNDMTMYANLAHAFLKDKDAGSGKAYKYYTAMKSESNPY